MAEQVVEVVVYIFSRNLDAIVVLYLVAVSYSVVLDIPLWDLKILSYQLIPS